MIERYDLHDQESAPEPSPRPLELERLAGSYSVCRAELGTALPSPPEGDDAGFWSLVVSDREISLVCRQELAPLGWRTEGPWRGVRVAGVLDFSLVGVLDALARPLAAARIPIFVVSSFDTDTLFVRSEQESETRGVLERAGHRLI